MSEIISEDAPSVEQAVEPATPSVTPEQMSENTGGRITFALMAEVRIITMDGTISTEIYQVETERSDRKGLVSLVEKGTTKRIKAQFRRVVPVDTLGQAVVIESGGKYRAVCPNCNYVGQITPSDNSLLCPSHGQFDLHWLGVKPMAETTVEKEKKVKPPKAEKAAKTAAPKAEKVPKVVKEPVKVDLAALAALPNCELWTNNNVRFDHERIVVRAYTLLFVGDSPRKYCFNTYNDCLGKKAESIPSQEFVADTAVKGGKKEKPWYSVANLEKAREKLTKDGYELYK